MVAALEIGENDRILEVGTGSGYVSAILAGLGREVVSIERYRTLAIEAAGKLVGEGFGSVRILHGDGLERLGLGRFERILMNGRIATMPTPIIEALAPGGRMVAVTGPAGSGCLEIFIGGPEGGIARREPAGPLDLPALQPGAFDAM
jgi:protein-L-isoaspartate(D-aspartate) O-methyltransferase